MTNGDKFITLTRVGFAARGLLYLIIAWLLVSTGRAADLDEALRYLSSGTERYLLGAIVVGFVTYGLWRLADAALDVEDHGDDAKGMVKRAGAAASGIIYLFLAYTAARLLLNGSSQSGGSGSNAEQQTQAVMQLPAGGVLVALGAAVLLGAGGWQIVKAVKGSFLKHLERRVANTDWALWFGRIGYAARGIIFIITGYFLAQAALSGNAAQAGGMQEALKWLSSSAAFAVAVGLGLFGLFSLIEARYRIISRPGP
jgi:hypothetical protein